MGTRGKVIISILLIFGLVLGGGAWWVKKNIFDDPLASQVDPETGKTIKAFNVLLLGSDARPDEKKGRTDTIIVAQISKERIAMLSIPRDTRVDIPGHGKQKINAAAYFEDPETTAQLVSEMIGQPVDKYILVRWEGFMKIVDAMGGVKVDVPGNITSYAMDGEDERVDLQKGVQQLNGKEALAFVRYRNEALGDIYRVGNQLEFMEALAAKCKQPSSVLKLPKALPELYKNIETNMDLKEMLVLAKAGMNFTDSSVLTQALPGYFFDLNGVSYWGYDPAQARQVVYDLFFNGITTPQVVMATPPGITGMNSSSNKPQQVAQQPAEEKEEEEAVTPPPKEEPEVIEVPLNPPPNPGGDGQNSGEGKGQEQGKEQDPGQVEGQEQGNGQGQGGQVKEQGQG